MLYCKKLYTYACLSDLGLVKGKNQEAKKNFEIVKCKPEELLLNLRPKLKDLVGANYTNGKNIPKPYLLGKEHKMVGDNQNVFKFRTIMSCVDTWNSRVDEIVHHIIKLFMEGKQNQDKSRQ